MVNNPFIPASQLSFDAYKASLKEHLKQQDRFKDFDFEGSNLSVLLDILALNTTNNAFYLNMVGSEAFLDSATLRASIVSRAKELNYTPRSRVSARAVVTIEIVPTDSPSTIVIPKNYQIKSSTTTDRQITFVTTQSYVVQRDSQGRYIKTGVEVREGELVTEFFNIEATTNNEYTTYNSRVILQSENIDINSIEVHVFETSVDTTPVQYERAIDVYGLSGNSRIFFVRGYSANQYEIEFGDGALGRALRTGNRVRVVYRDTLGSAANGRLSFSRTSAIQGYSNILITVTESPSGGAERETNESIKFNAPRFYQTQERGVIDVDFKTLIRTNFPEVQSSNVYGGERIKRYGNVVVAVKPEGGTGRASTSLKKRLKAFLETKTLTTQVIVVDPTYFYLRVDARVTYDLNLVTTNTDNVKTTIVNALADYNDTNLNAFGIQIFNSKLESIIDQADASIIGSEANLSLVYQWTPNQLNVSDTLTLNVGNPLLTTSTTTFAVSSTPFFVLDAAGIPIEVYVRDNRFGTLVMFATSDDSIISQNVGTVNYETGDISTNLTVQGYNGANIDWNISLRNRQVNIDLNQFVLLDSAYINVNLVAR